MLEIIFSWDLSFVVSLSIFFEPEVFFSKPGELAAKENGVALLKGKKVTVKIPCTGRCIQCI